MITHDPTRGLFEDDTPHGPIYVSYAIRADDVLDITYSFVPPPLRGQHLAVPLVSHARDWAREQGMSVTASCSYAARVLANLP
jgi:predicted GNAT family acetyltransferase